MREIERLANRLDACYTVPGTKIQFGWDGLIGLVPVVGDTLTTLPQIYLLYKARKLELGWFLTLRMLLNIAINWAVGSVPVVGGSFRRRD